MSITCTKRRSSAAQLAGAEIDPATHLVRKEGQVIGVEIDGKAVTGFTTPSRKLEFFSQTLKDWHWPEYALPGYIKSHVHRDHIDQSQGRIRPAADLPPADLIHTRAGNAKWLYEISHTNPLWLHPRDAERLGVDAGRSGQGAYGDRLLRHSRLDHRSHSPWRGGVLASPRALAS